VHLITFFTPDYTIAGFKTIPSRYTWYSFRVRNRMDNISSWTCKARFIPYSPLLNISGSTMGTIRALWQMLANLYKTRHLKIFRVTQWISILRNDCLQIFIYFNDLINVNFKLLFMLNNYIVIVYIVKNIGFVENFRWLRNEQSDACRFLRASASGAICVSFYEY